MHYKRETEMKKLISKFSFTGLMGLLMLGFSQVALSEEMVALVEEVATINSGDTWVELLNSPPEEGNNLQSGRGPYIALLGAQRFGCTGWLKKGESTQGVVES
jgi:hypothetical protein